MDISLIEPVNNYSMGFNYVEYLNDNENMDYYEASRLHNQSIFNCMKNLDKETCDLIDEKKYENAISNCNDTINFYNKNILVNNFYLIKAYIYKVFCYVVLKEYDEVFKNLGYALDKGLKIVDIYSEYFKYFDEIRYTPEFQEIGKKLLKKFPFENMEFRYYLFDKFVKKNECDDAVPLPPQPAKLIHDIIPYNFNCDKVSSNEKKVKEKSKIKNNKIKTKSKLSFKKYKYKRKTLKKSDKIQKQPDVIRKQSDVIRKQSDIFEKQVDVIQKQTEMKNRTDILQKHSEIIQKHARLIQNEILRLKKARIQKQMELQRQAEFQKQVQIRNQLQSRINSDNYKLPPISNSNKKILKEYHVIEAKGGTKINATIRNNLCTQLLMNNELIKNPLPFQMEPIVREYLIK